jgi:hypothetical protein
MHEFTQSLPEHFYLLSIIADLCIMLCNSPPTNLVDTKRYMLKGVMRYALSEVCVKRDSTVPYFGRILVYKSHKQCFWPPAP